MNQSLQDNDTATTVYQQKLHPWCIVHRLAKMQNRTVARFRHRNDADDHLRLLRQLSPSMRYTIVFDLVLRHDVKVDLPVYTNIDRRMP
ncbi:hypothetical protein [Leptolyngbya sp. BC1307]|uniref:hypothetical protein n=1 Tax=Leptolyngbya sp. BC1307 TaxID=2029589 RepID=UPI000EFAEDEA|nr:hypothetical protein [Leptolyngbya sp. BC1307]